MALRSGNNNRSPGDRSTTLSGKTVGYSANKTGGEVSKGNIVASGGDEFIIGDYKYHVFTSTDYLAVTDAPTLSSLQFTIIAGGGNAQGPIASGGSGAGGFVNGTTSQGQVGIGSHLITVGGAGGNSFIFADDSIPGDGTRSPSSANDITTVALAGGPGGAENRSGGSGGGGNGWATYTGATPGTPGQGNAGSDGVDTGPPYYYRNGGGGGGAGGDGYPGGRPGGSPSPIPEFCGWGGIGKAIFNGDSFPTSYGTPGPYSGRWFGGGGGTAGVFTSVDASGGVGGGGSDEDGAQTNGGSPVRNGLINTGGGSSGSGNDTVLGGSGIVVIRYTISANYNYPTLNPA